MLKAKAAILDSTWLRVSILLALFMGAYYVPLKSLVHVWWENEDYSYGFLIPIAAAYLLWEKRKTFAEIPIRTSWRLLPILVLFILISLYGILGSSGYVSMASIPVLIILFTGFCFGIESVKKLALPLGFLFLMVPVPPVIEGMIGVYLKAVSSRMGGAFIGFFDIPVHVSGNIIDLGVTQLQVVDACSGMRYIFPLLALGILYAYFFERVVWKRLFCVLVTIPLGILFNALRIGITGILTNLFGPKVSEGFFHDFSGWVIFLFAFVVLFLISRLLALFSLKTVGNKDATVPEPGHAAASTVEEKKTTGAFLCSVALLSCVAVISLSTSTLPAVSIKGGIKGFPLVIEEWKGRQEIVGPAIVRESGAEEAFNGYFIDGAGSALSLYIGYRSTAFLSNDNFFHSPTVCLPSSGWMEQGVKRKIIANVPHFNKLEVTEMVIEKDGIMQLVYFWFQTKDEATYDKNVNRFHLSLHAIRRDNTYDLFIRPVTSVKSLEGIEGAEKRLDGFVREMMPVLLRFLKEKQVRV